MPTEVHPEGPVTPGLLGLPPQTRACLFDLDGVTGLELPLDARIDGTLAAGRAGGFAMIVVGVDRVGHGNALREHGAGVVVIDLEQLIITPGAGA